MTLLKTLQLYNCRIFNDIDKLTNLKKLEIISYEKSITLPKSMFLTMHNLKTLQLTGKITNVHQILTSICELPNLEYLIIDSPINKYIINKIHTKFKIIVMVY